MSHGAWLSRSLKRRMDKLDHDPEAAEQRERRRLEGLTDAELLREARSLLAQPTNPDKDKDGENALLAAEIEEFAAEIALHALGLHAWESWCSCVVCSSRGPVPAAPAPQRARTALAIPSAVRVVEPVDVPPVRSVAPEEPGEVKVVPVAPDRCPRCDAFAPERLGSSAWRCRYCGLSSVDAAGGRA